MESRISPGLVAEIKYAVALVKESGIDEKTLCIIREIASRRLAEIEAEIAKFPEAEERSDS